MGDIKAQETLATTEYGRQQEDLKRKRTRLEENKDLMVGIAALGGLSGLASSFYDYSSAGTFDFIK